MTNIIYIILILNLKISKYENYNRYSTTNNNNKIVPYNKNFQLINGIIEVFDNIKKTKTYKKNNSHYMDYNQPLKNHIEDITEINENKDFQNDLDDIIIIILIKKSCSKSDNSDIK